MNKSVYLYELDSVRNSKEEIQYAQERMFQEIILNGNQVILTMNQLADSRAFLAAIENENTFDYFLSKEIRSRIFWWRRVYHAETFRKWNSISGI